jgi:predicted  nucleic acid-binding Zn-ribbon protein
MEAAIRRLISALNGLEAVVERRQENDRNQDNLAARIQALGIDRSRLADELDEAQGRLQTLEDANRQIAVRLDGAIGTIRSVLDPEEEQP